MSFKDNYVKYSKKFGGTHVLIGKGLSKSTVNSIMAGSMPLADTAYKVAKALGVTVEDLVEKPGDSHGKVAEEGLLDEYGKKLEPEEAKYISKLMAILRGKNNEVKELITCVLDTIASNKEWIKAGRKERRKRPSPTHKDRHERRKRIHLY